MEPTITLHHGKFEEIDRLAPRADLCIADPPDNVAKGYDGYRDNLPEGEYCALIRDWVLRCCEVTDGPVFFTFDQRWIPEVEHAIRQFNLRLVQRCWWYYTFGQASSARYSPCVRPIYWLNDARFFPDAIRVPSARQVKYNDARANPAGKIPDNLWRFSRVCGTFHEKRHWHPCQLPEALVERIILGHSKPGGTILDPFVGSGTTVYVGAEHGRNVMGIDQSRHYLEEIDRECHRRRLPPVEPDYLQGVDTALNGLDEDPPT